MDRVINKNDTVCHLIAMSCPSSQEVVVSERWPTNYNLRQLETFYRKFEENADIFKAALKNINSDPDDYSSFKQVQK
ncbi:hypothetical protein PS15p_210181 [Mucor circinelloides]